MKKEDFAKHLEGIFDRLRAVREAGQKEYAHGATDNAFNNFERNAAELGIPREKVLWIFAMKHKDGILAYLNGHRSQRESVHERIKDLMLYLALLDGMIAEDEAKARAPFGVITVVVDEKTVDIKTGDTVALNSKGEIEAYHESSKCEMPMKYANLDDEPLHCRFCGRILGSFGEIQSCGTRRFCRASCHKKWHEKNPVVANSPPEKPAEENQSRSEDDGA